MDSELDRRVDAAVTAVRSAVATSGNAKDAAYFALHEARFRWTVQRIASIAPPNGRLLDFGSHYLHQGAMLAALGYQVVGMDLSVHSTAPFVCQRAESFGIENRTVDFDAVAEGTFSPSEMDCYDLVVFCEILEHITFNPIAFWHRIHDLVRVGGEIYITTPNSLKLLSVLGATRGLLTGHRLGLNVRQIFSQATYGHHWKEYSAGEIRDYFGTLSPDFRVRVGQVHMSGGPSPFPDFGVANRAKDVLRRIGNASGLFAEQLEAVITLDRRTPWELKPPQFT